MKRSRWDTPSPPVPSAKHQQPPPWNNVPRLPQQHQLQQQHLPQQHQLPQQQVGAKRGRFQQQQFGKGRGKKKKNKKGNAAK